MVTPPGLSDAGVRPDPIFVSSCNTSPIDFHRFLNEAWEAHHNFSSGEDFIKTAETNLITQSSSHRASWFRAPRNLVLGSGMRKYTRFDSKPISLGRIK